MAADREISRLIEAATISDVPFWKTVGTFLEGRRLVLQGKFAAAVTVLRKAFDICRRTGWQVSYPENRGALAEALAGLGQVDAALTAVDEAVGRAGHGSESQVWYVPELLRIKGEILLQQGSIESSPWRSVATSKPPRWRESRERCCGNCALLSAMHAG